MSGPFKMKGSSGLGYGNQHSKGKGVPMIGEIVGGIMGKKEEASPAPYASPAKTETTKSKVTKKRNITKDLKKKTTPPPKEEEKKTELNQFGETPEQYKARMKEMGLQNNKNND